MPPPLVPAHRRATAVIVVAISTAVVAALAAVVYHGSRTRFDHWASQVALHRVGAVTGYRLLDTSRPSTVIAVLAVVALGAVTVRRWDVVAFSVAAPAISVLVTEQLLKPAIDRTLGPLHGSYPSGHETAVAAAGAVLFVVLGQVRLSAASRVASGVLLTAWAAVAAVALVRNFYHYATDTIGGFGVALAVVPATALAIDLVSSRVARSPARTAHAA